MYKVIPPNWSFGDTARVSAIPMSSRGLTGMDKSAFAKRASAELLDKLDSLERVPGEELAHLIALGATEVYGPNRNGDGFKRAACKQYHPSFVKEARFYRNHENKDKSKSYGVVKLSAYNDIMDRVELIVGLNGTPKVAKLNNGFVADQELEKLANGEDLAVSMAAAVKRDVCSYCGNSSPTRAQYCTDFEKGGSCKAGGLKEHMGELRDTPEGAHMLHADNPEPHFFDISHVYVPADRTAYVTGMLHKAAAASEYLGGAALAEMYGMITPYADETTPVRISTKYAQCLQHLCDAVDQFHGQRGWVKVGSAGSVASYKPLTKLAVATAFRPAQVTQALAEAHMCLTPSQFVQLTYNVDYDEAIKLGEAIGPLSNDKYHDIQRYETTRNPYLTEERTPEALRFWAHEQALPQWTKEGYRKQAAYNTIISEPKRSLSLSNVYALKNVPQIEDLAKKFALYKAAYLHTLPEDQQHAVSRLLVCRDYLSF